jgi:hypothetical protein
MIRGANAQFKFKLPYNYSELETVKITFWQPENNGPATNRPLPIVKILAQCSQTNNPKELSITLNQEETLRFSEERKGFVQLRAQTIEGIPIVSKEKQFTVYPVYDDSILDEEILPTPEYDGWIYLDGSIVE